MTESRETLDLVDTVATRVGSSLTALTTVGASDVFSEPVQSGDRVVITAAAVTRGGGFGFGAGGGPGDQGAGLGGGGGAGGGGGSEGRPVAVIEITPEGTTVRPVLDFTKIGLTLLAGLFGLWRAGKGARKR